MEFLTRIACELFDDLCLGNETGLEDEFDELINKLCEEMKKYKEEKDKEWVDLP